LDINIGNCTKSRAGFKTSVNHFVNRAEICETLLRMDHTAGGSTLY